MNDERHPTKDNDLAFDIVAQLRERARRAELRVDGLERARDRLVRVLALAIQVAAGQDCKPLVLLRALEEMLDTADALPAERGHEELAELLIETDPDRRRKKEARCAAA